VNTFVIIVNAYSLRFYRFAWGARRRCRARLRRRGADVHESCCTNRLEKPLHSSSWCFVQIAAVGTLFPVRGCITGLFGSAGVSFKSRPLALYSRYEDYCASLVLVLPPCALYSRCEGLYRWCSTFYISEKKDVNRGMTICLVTYMHASC